MIAHHLMLRLADDRVLSPTVATQRAFARAVHDIGPEGGLLAFRAADTHAHVLLRCDREEAGAIGRALEVRLRWALDLPVPFAPLHIKPVASQSHLGNAFRYVLSQDQRHATGHDPHHEASALPDLLGLRPRGAWIADQVRAWLPRVQREDLEPMLGADLDAELRWEDLRESAAAAVALPDLQGNGPEAVEARRAAVALAGETLDTARIAELLGVTRRSVQRLIGQPASRPLVRAIRLQLALRAGRHGLCARLG